MDKDCYSFDIFDTALVRIWARPSDLFFALAEQLAKNGLSSLPEQEWRSLRIASEIEARNKSIDKDITLADIYDIMRPVLNWTEETKIQALNTEIELEQEALVSVPEIKHRIINLRQQKHRIIYISDMYLPSSAVKSLLQTAGLWEKGDKLYLSSEQNAVKSDGSLFLKCLDQERLDASRLCHTGDNFRSDCHVPETLGIAAEWFSATQLNRYEKDLVSNPDLPLIFKSLMAGTCRLIRLQSHYENPQQQIISDTAVNVAAPILLGYIFWCLQQAENLGISRLYFISRDGQVLFRIAQVLCAEWGFRIECRYLYGSRQAWHLPAISKLGQKDEDWIFENTSFLSVRSVCERVGISPVQISAPLEQAGFPGSQWDNDLNLKQRKLLKSAFRGKIICDVIEKKAAALRDDMYGYLRQEGIEPTASWGLVDIGWKGRQQYSLSRLLDLNGAYPDTGVTGFYYSLLQSPNPYKKDRLFSFITYPDQATYVPLYEIFTAADHGKTMGYKKEPEGKIIPVLKEPGKTQKKQWDVPKQQKAIESFCRVFAHRYPRQKISADDFRQAEKGLRRLFLKHPTVKEAAVFGDYLYCEDQGENIYFHLAPEIKRRDFWRWFFSRGSLISQVTWVEGAIRRSFRPGSIYLYSFKLRKFLLKKIFRTGGN